nr:hypothetical protein [uncultured Flavobacterium sp.]
MKKILTFSLALLLIPSVFGASTLNIINVTTNYTLYFNLVTKSYNCYPEIREYYPSSPTGSGYCDLVAGGAISFNNYTELNSYYPGILLTRKNSSSATPSPLPINLADNYLTILNMEWANIIYKVTHNTSGHTEGVWLGFSDFYSCHGLPDSWGTYGITETESFTSFTIGGDRYFIVGEY